MRQFIISTIILSLLNVSAHADPLKVFVSILPLKQFVERIGGDQVEVTVMVGPGQSPATYSPTPHQMMALSQAKIYFAMGALPFEQAWGKRIQATNPDMQWVRTDQGITLKTRNEAHDEHDHGHGHDPHVWLSPQLARQMSRTILTALQTHRPQQAETFSRNHAVWDAELQKLHTDIQAMFADLPSRQFMVFHASWGYFADTYGLKQIAIEASGKEPGPQALARLIELARDEKISAIFVQKQFSQHSARSVAKAVGAVVVEVDPLAENYLDNLREAARLFVQAPEAE